MGELMDRDEVLDFATIDEADIIAALEWWNEHASDDFEGALESRPDEGD